LLLPLGPCRYAVSIDRVAGAGGDEA